jgi:hypothetical protein
MKATNWKRAAVLVGLMPLMALSLGCNDDNCDIVIIDRHAPAAPLEAHSVTGDETVTLFWVWNTESDFDHYEIFWRFEGESRFEFLAVPRNDDYVGNFQFYVDRDLENGTTYEYVIVTVDKAGNVSEDSDLVYDTPRPEGSVKLYNIEKRHLGGSYLKNAYDFSDFRRTDWETDTEADILFSYNEGLYLMEAGDVHTDIQDAGWIPLDVIDWAPDEFGEGWSGTGTVELIVGHSYIVWTRTDNFAKFQVVDLTEDYVMIDWAYQEVTGLPELLRPVRTATASRAARGG